MNKLAVLSLVTLCCVAACGSPVVLDTPNGEVGVDVDGGDEDGGGSTTGGNTSGGNSTGGNSTGGNSTGGNTSGGNSTGGNTTGGGTSGGTSGGSTDGSTSGGSTGGSTDGSTTGGNTGGGDCDGGKPVCVPAERCDVCVGQNKCSSHVSNGCGGFYDCSTDKDCNTCVPKKTKELCNGHSCQTVKDGCGGTLFCGHALECQSCDRAHDRCVDACNARGAYCHPDCKKNCDDDLKCCQDRAND